MGERERENVNKTSKLRKKDCGREKERARELKEKEDMGKQFKMRESEM